MVDFVRREAWGAAEPADLVRVRRRPLADVTKVIIHYSSTPAPVEHDDCAAAVRAIQAFHQGPARDWNDVAYHRLYCPHGTVFEGRPLFLLGSHCRGHNATGVGHCFITDWDATPEARAACRSQVAADEAVLGHRLSWHAHGDLVGTHCPGEPLARWTHDVGHEFGLRARVSLYRSSRRVRRVLRRVLRR